MWVINLTLVPIFGLPTNLSLVKIADNLLNGVKIIMKINVI